MAIKVAVQHEGSAKDRIVAAGRKMFAERGFHQTAMADLALEANVSVGAIYRSFAGKAEIIDAIVRDDTAQIMGDLQVELDQVRRGEAPVRIILERMVLKWLSRKDDALGHEIVAEGHRNPKVAQAISVICCQLREMFRELALVMQPELSDSQREAAAELFLACMFGMGNRQFTLPKLDDQEMAKAVAELLMEGLAIKA